MASKTKKTRRIRDRKKRPNKANLKADMKRIKRNTELLRELSAENHA
ncbi:MAG: hypothetical protein JRJ03_02480 [Deltaproteobacteria bacterium]|nr:hypothetical protein [Deltaproteobacteria bacterium]